MNHQLFVRTLLIVCSFLASLAKADDPKPNTLSAEEAAAGWILLFDGESDFGWKAATKANWQFKDGVISVGEGTPGLLCTTSEFGDFQLKADFRAAPATNSGIFLRTPEMPTDPKQDCYELNIAGPKVSPFATGSFVGRAKATKISESDGWQSFDVTAQNGHFVVLLDGNKVLEYNDPKPLGRGFIGLQFNSGQVEFRNLKLKPLGLESLFNGRDLANWRVFPGKQSEFSVTPDGCLSIKNGPGQLESSAQFADFCLQVEVKTQGKNLNSGVFFRSIPGQLWQGYEAQIQNGFVDGNRAQPVDGGTGGIYRRQPARRVVSNDYEWFLMTVVATGNHIATWVNGYPVADWTDPRPEDENPRKGSRLAAGTIILQGHDATTDLLFRHFSAGELPAR